MFYLELNKQQQSDGVYVFYNAFFIQAEDTFQKGQEKDKEDPNSKSDIKGEDNAIEMSEDFDGKMHGGELEEQGLWLLLHSCF